MQSRARIFTPDKTQQRRQDFIRSVTGRRMHPFDYREHNDFFEATNLQPQETWDYRDNLGFEYDSLEDTNNQVQICKVNVTNDGRGFARTRQG